MRHKPGTGPGLWRQVFYFVGLSDTEKNMSDYMDVLHAAITSLCNCIVFSERLDHPSAHPRYREYSGLFVASASSLTPQTPVIPPSGDRQCRSAACLDRSTPPDKELIDGIHVRCGLWRTGLPTAGSKEQICRSYL